MYSKLKCRVNLDGHFSNFVTSNIGLMQGESLSPLLYSFYYFYYYYNSSIALNLKQ
jgi:hypothetical protein